MSRDQNEIDAYYATLTKGLRENPPSNTAEYHVLRRQSVLAAMRSGDAEIDRMHRLLPNTACPTAPKAPVVADSSTFKMPLLPRVTDVFKDIVMGENAHVFCHLEVMINAMRESGITHSLLLIGPPSVGKTSTAQLIARAVERPYYSTSGSIIGTDLIKLVTEKLIPLHKGEPYSEVYRHGENAFPVYRLKPTTLFIDEAHALCGAVQDALLMTLEHPHLLAHQDGYLDFRDVLIILGTTDPTKNGRGIGLAKPLRTRCTELVYQAYSAETVAEIVRRRHPRLDQEDALRLARAAKLIPRVALAYASQAGRIRISAFLNDCVGVDAEGLDSLDRKMLGLLRGSITRRSGLKVTEAELILEAASRGESIPAIQVVKARSLLAHREHKPMSLAAITDRLQMTDELEVRVRVHYLESLGLVVRTPRGVIYVDR